MKLILLLFSYTCFGAGEDFYKVPEGKPRIYFDGTNWKTMSPEKQTTVLRARRRLPDLTKLFELYDEDITQEHREVETSTVLNPSVHNIINQIVNDIQTRLQDKDIRHMIPIQSSTTHRLHPIHVSDWLITTTTTRRSYLDFIDAITDSNNNQDINDVQTIDAADLWYGTEPTRKRKTFHKNVGTKPTQPHVQIQPLTTTTLRTTTSTPRDGFNERIKKLISLLSSYNSATNETANIVEEKKQFLNETTANKDNTQIQSQIDDLKKNRDKLIGLILDLLNRLKKILGRKNGTDPMKYNNKLTVHKNDPMNARKVAQKADLLFSELSYNIDLDTGDVLSDTEMIRDMEDIDVRNEKYMDRMFGLNTNIPKDTVNEKEIYDYPQFENPADRSGGVEYETRYKIYNRSE